MKYILIFLLLTLTASAQFEIARNVTKFNRVHLATDNAGGADSVLLFTLPANVELRYFSIHCDTALTPGGSDSLKIGISGESALSSLNYRIGDLHNDSLAAGDNLTLCSNVSRCGGQGGMYAYESEILLACADDATFYTINGLLKTPTSNFPVNATGSAITVPRFYDGMYTADVMVSFQSNKVATAHGIFERSGVLYTPSSFERTISNVNQTGNAGTLAAGHLAAGDTVGFRMQSTATNTIFEITHMQLLIEPVGGSEPYRTDKPRSIYLYTGAQAGTFRFYLEYVEIFN